ncbi:TonB-dependent receptor [Pseudomonas sp. 21LCFQ02]|uniref:TonB-dependent siderophore receptor n=1 Tax=Pseudomonas sp. 21LCFQ02 TaxID=2957505 RepID=UPI00209B0C7D|nr:TonB-dependent receptor [Pseudomonas sp. 21LCFQ02]MCO8170956.1 TonB-dependent receptor [Pseudomonas sp. 21LCFQ02]
MGYLKGSVLAPCLALGLLSGSCLNQALADTGPAHKLEHFALPAGSLDQVLLQISRQGAVAISFEQDTLRGLRSGPVSGELTVDQAIDQALRGTGLRKVRSDVGVSIERDTRPASSDTRLNTVTVVGKQPSAKLIAGALGSASDLKTPFSTRQVTSEQIEERQLKAMSNVFSADTSVDAKGDSYSLTASNLSVRGVRLDNGGSYKINGLPIFITTLELPLETFESVQLLKGASGFMYGFGAPGGVVNYVTKKPTDDFKFSVDAGVRSNNVWSEHVDLGGRFGPGDGDTFGYRLNAVHEEGETPTRSHVKRDSASLSLDARINDNLTWTADTLYQERVINGGIQNYRLPSYTGSRLPAVVSSDSDRSGIEGTVFESRAWMAATGLHWNITPDWSASLDYNHFDQQRNYISEYPTLLNKAGDYSELLSTGDGNAVYDQVQAMLQGEFSTGPIGHKIVLGASWQGYDRYSATTSLFQVIGTGTNNLYRDPVKVTYTGRLDFPSYHVSYIEQRAIFASDTLDLTHGWSLLAGLRLTEYTQDIYNTAGAKTSSYRKTPLTPTIALMYQPRPDTTLYASYVEALEAGETAGTSYANAGETLNPIESKQYEVGVKTEREHWGGSFAVFRLERGAQYGNSAGVYVQDGEQRYQGVELNGYLDITDSTRVTSSSTWLDATFTKSEAALVGNRASGVPRFQQVLQISQDIPGIDGLKLYADARYRGVSEANDSNTLQVPGYTLFSAGASYRIPVQEHEVILRANVDNLANREYWAFATSNSVYLGTPRTVSLNVSFDY